MNAQAEWVLRMPWLVQLLSLWLKIPKISLVLSVMIVLSLLFTSYHLSAWLNYTRPVAATPVDNLSQTQTISTAASISRLPDVSGFTLYELAQQLGNPEISQQGGKFNLNFTTSWQSFAEFINQIAQSSFAPESYRMQWGPLNPNLSPSVLDDLTMQLDLAPGGYLEHSKQVMPLPPANQSKTTQVEEYASSATPACIPPPPPEFILQASWPSRGYIQVHSEGRIERVSVNQMLQKSWQLLRISSDSLEFRWHNIDSPCNNQKPVTVAI